MKKFATLVGLDVVKVITGMRRSGKSVLLEQIRDEVILKDDPKAVVFYLNLEEEENSAYLKKGVLATDHGMRRALVGGDVQQDIDQVLENIVYFELVRRGWKVTVGRVRTKEIDFVAEKGGEKTYFQVAYLMPTQSVRDREFGAFADIGDNYPRYVLSMDPVGMSANGIRHLNICDFLLERG